MRGTITITLLAVALLLLAACQPTADSATSIDLAGTSWNMRTLAGDPPLAETVVSLQFESDGTASGSDGCNQFTTSYTQDGANLTFEQANGVSTLMACDEPVMTQAAAFQEALVTTKSFSATEQELVFLDGNGNEVATFTAVSQELSGTSWIVTSYNNGREAVVGVISDTEMTVSFGEDGELSGTAGCNNYFASYEVDAEAGTITIDQIGLTDMACEGPEGIMEQEQAFLTALATAATYRVQGNTLELRTADNALAVMLQRAQ